MRRGQFVFTPSVHSLGYESALSAKLQPALLLAGPFFEEWLDFFHLARPSPT